MIKIKVGLIDDDKIYLERFTRLMSEKHGSQIELFSFTDPEKVSDSVQKNGINVLVASGDSFTCADDLSGQCGFAYFTESAEIDTIDGRKTIFRYQNSDGLYRALLGLYSEKVKDGVSYRAGAERAKISLFVPECEGAGASTAAAAMAEYSASEGKKTLFLNLRQFGGTEELFTAPGETSFTDVIFALKSRKANIMKLESIVRKSAEGVFFFGNCRNPLDSTELSREELSSLIDTLEGSCGYDRIVIVSDFFLSEKLSLLLGRADDVIIVSGDTPLSEQRILQKRAVIDGLEKREMSGLKEKIRILFNKSAKTLQLGIPVMGVIPDTGSGRTRDIVKRMTDTGVFRCLCREEAPV
ncbi:hypothetical protein [Ruminococcus sp. HUN007]|uniref:hypothetical protein n=1 Tax=Ruminococcus sp. HUN007 TaxID=1514668 RepID=UPI0005D24015|nr:hypothetical protein [Ruminococcus sp. HUN007]